MALKSYRELEVWKRSMDLAEEIYRLTNKWPDHERFGLISQSRRAASSIPLNISEGYGRTFRGEYLYHLSVASGSVAELETALILSGRLGYTRRAEARVPWQLAQAVGRMLGAQIKALETSDSSDGSRRRRSATTRSAQRVLKP